MVITKIEMLGTQKHTNDEVAILTIMKHMIEMMKESHHGEILRKQYSTIEQKELSKEDIIDKAMVLKEIKDDIFNQNAILTHNKIRFFELQHKIALANKIKMSVASKRNAEIQPTNEAYLVNSYIIHLTKNYQQYYQTQI